MQLQKNISKSKWPAISTLLVVGFLFFGFTANRAEAALIKAPNNLGLVGYWSFEDGRGATSTDFSGNGNHGALTNFALSTSTSNWNSGNACKRGNCLNFDGTSDYVDAGNIAVNGWTTLTLSAWIKSNDITQVDQNIIAKWDYATQGTFGMGISTSGQSGKVHIWLPDTLNSNGSNDRTDTVNAVIQSGQWYHVVAVFDGSLSGDSNRQKIYINGAQVATQQGSGSVPASLTSGGSATVKIGKFGGSLTRYFYGSLDEVRIYNRALSATEVSALYNSGVTKIKTSQADLLTNGLVLYHPFSASDLTATTSSDRTANNNDGTRTGTVPAVGKVGQGLNFNGTTGNVNFGDIDAVDGQSALSVFAWVKMTIQDGRISSIVHKQVTADTNNRFSLSPSQAGLGGDNDILVLMGNGANTYGYTNSNILPLNTWTHVGFVFDGSLSGNSNVLKIYTNGVAQNVNYSGTIPSTTASTTAPLRLGYYDNSSANGYFPGIIDEPRIYNRALSADEVRKLYDAGR